MSVALNADQATDRNLSLALLLNAAHALDHLVLLIFAAAVGAIAADFGFARWEDLMPYTAGAFFAFGLGSLPAGRLGDTWGRRSMMLVFFFGIGVALLLVAMTQTAGQMAVALTVVGVFAAIYHPVGIPMLVQGSTRPGRTIGINAWQATSASRWQRCSPDCWSNTRVGARRSSLPLCWLLCSVSCSHALRRWKARRHRGARQARANFRRCDRAGVCGDHDFRDKRQFDLQLHHQRQRRDVARADAGDHR